MRRLAILVVLAGVLLAGDQVARLWAQSELAERAAAYYPPSTRSEASIRSFPFLGRLLAGGNVPEVTLDMEGLRAGTVLIRRLDLDLRDVEISRGALLRGRVELEDIGSGRMEARLDGPSLAQALGADLRFAAGTVEVHKRVAGRDVYARGRITVSRNVLRLVPTSVQGVGLPASAFALTITFPGADLWPCQPEVSVVDDGLQVGCTVTDVPRALVRASQN